MFKQISDRILFKQPDSPCGVMGVAQLSEYDGGMRRSGTGSKMTKRVGGFANNGSDEGIMEPPKRPPGAYACFLGKLYPEMKEKYPDEPLHMIGREISKLWKSMDDTSKETYKAESRQKQEDYQRELEFYESRLTMEEKEALKEAAKMKKLRKEKRFLKKERRAMNMPKQAKNQYAFFLQSEKRRDDEDIISYAKRCADKWKGFSELERKAFLDMALQDKVRYLKEIDEWEMKMIKSGHFEVIRQRSRDIAMSAMKRSQRQEDMMQSAASNTIKHLERRRRKSI